MGILLLKEEVLIFAHNLCLRSDLVEDKICTSLFPSIILGST